MKIRYNSTLVSTLIWTLCLVTMIPASASQALTWRRLFIDLGSVQIENYWAPFGFAYLGIVMIGLIVLWTGYRKRERWAWFVLLIILLCFDFPWTWLPIFLRIHAGMMGWGDVLGLYRAFGITRWWQCLTTMPSPDEAVGIDCFSISIAAGLVRSLVMLLALLLPVKAFFWRPAAR